ncbi:MAG: hypothetical protein CMK83_25555 [Pseudomonadales bacterium]|nr:hypothetical protein [Pseudomonadales bacterium]|tara:strand:+ start:10335 stop:10652 length:318 start_codon:yes stop_codon:yes gene_type:complete
MLFGTFISIICIEIILAFKFSRMARLAIERSNEVGIGLFDRTYHSVPQLYMDFNFLNDLLDGKGSDSIKDSKLSSSLSQMRMVLIGQLVGGLAFFLLGIGLGLSG